MTSADVDLVMACRDIRVIATLWWGAAAAAGVAAVFFGCLYHFGVRFRMPRLRTTAKRLAKERDAERAGRLLAEQTAATYKARIESIGLEAQKEIARVDAIRKKTERALTDEKDVSESLRAFLAAVNSQSVDIAIDGSPDRASSWFPSDVGETITVAADGAAS